MKIYLAGPLFTVVELDFNRRLKAVLEASGHAVWLPQEHTPKHGDAHGILAVLLDGLRHADVVVANMDGADPELRNELGMRLCLCVRRADDPFSN